MYAIGTERARNFIDVRLGGMMSVSEVADYVGELRARFVREQFRAGYRILIDVTDCPIQSQETVNAVRDHISTMPKAGPIAMVTGSSLARVQVRRVMTQTYAEVFALRDEALHWLLSSDHAAAENVRAAG